MTQPHFIVKRYMRPASDACLGFVAFFLLTAVVSGGLGAAAMEAGPRALAAGLAPLGVLAACFSLLVAFNLAIYRHLRRVYASPRRGAWRRD